MDKELPNKQGVLLDMYGDEEFSRDVIRQFPTLRADLEENANLLHIQMGTLAGAVRQALSLGEVDLPLRICQFLDDTLSQPQAISEIENAVAISFIEAREFRDAVTGPCGVGSDAKASATDSLRTGASRWRRITPGLR